MEARTLFQTLASVIPVPPFLMLTVADPASGLWITMLQFCGSVSVCARQGETPRSKLKV